MVKMKFGDFEFPTNPAQLEVSASTNVKSSPIFGIGSSVQNVSREPVTVKGSGRFYGEDAEQSCAFLQHMLRRGKSEVLFIPSAGSLNAYLTRFTYGRDVSGGASYSFEFTENCNNKSELCAVKEITAAEGDNAFNIAARCGVSVNEIMRKNNFKNAFDINAGDRVRIL